MAKRFKGDPHTIAMVLQARIRKKLERFEIKDIEFRQTMLSAAFLIQAQTVLNIRRKLNRNSRGPLRESIKVKTLSASEILVGSFGIPYARIHEFGFQGFVDVRAHTRVQTMAFGRTIQDPRAVQVKAHSRLMNVPARPYFAPAIQSNRQRIINMFTDLIGKKLASD